MFASRCHIGICLLALPLALALVGPGWAQTATPPASEPAKAYGQAVSLLEQAQQQLDGEESSRGPVPGETVQRVIYAPSEGKRRQTGRSANFPLKKASSWPSTKNWPPRPRPRRIALLETAAAKGKQAKELRAQGQAEAGDAAERESKEQYLQAQNLSIKAAIYALCNQQIIFRFLAP